MTSKQWFMHYKSGDHAFLTEDDRGNEVIQWDRPGQLKQVPYVEAEWIPIEERQPLTDNMKAQVCHAADAALCRVMGHRGGKEWVEMTQRMQQLWMKEGPGKSKPRMRLFKAIRKVIDEID